jgi:hypothetical protein
MKLLAFEVRCLGRLTLRGKLHIACLVAPGSCSHNYIIQYLKSVTYGHVQTGFNSNHCLFSFKMRMITI